MTDLLALAGRAPDGWLAIAREAEDSRLAELIAALDQAKLRARHHDFVPRPDGHEEADRAVLAAARGADACWASMRDGAHRVYLVQSTTDVTAAVQQALAAFEDTPKVEVFAPDQPLPEYHERALLAATLLWSATPKQPVTVARTFDGAGADGPWFAPDHERVADPAHRRKLLDFLTGGEVVLTAGTRLADVVTGTPDRVPASLRSDGTWVWSEASTYYLDHHQFAPDPDLAAHALAHRPPDRLSPLVRHRVRAALTPQEDPPWRAG